MKYLAVLKKNAHSFRWGGAILSERQLDDASTLYAFCRFIDDLADESTNLKKAESELLTLKKELLDNSPSSELISDFLVLAKRTGLPLYAALDLIDGALSDVHENKIVSEKDLLHYCYQVAGTVGLMMSPLIGVKNPLAIQNAKDLGIAMQLTNILRDVHADARLLRRVYLPADYLEKEGLTTKDLLQNSIEEDNLPQLRIVYQRVFDLAEIHYENGLIGLKYIPFRARIAIFVATVLYRAIGIKVMTQFPQSFQKRCYLRPREKVLTLMNVLMRKVIGRSYIRTPVV